MKTNLLSGKVTPAFSQADTGSAIQASIRASLDHSVKMKIKHKIQFFLHSCCSSLMTFTLQFYHLNQVHTKETATNSKRHRQTCSQWKQNAGVPFQPGTGNFCHQWRAQSPATKQNCAVKFASLALKWVLYAQNVSACKKPFTSCFIWEGNPAGAWMFNLQKLRLHLPWFRSRPSAVNNGTCMKREQQQNFIKS